MRLGRWQVVGGGILLLGVMSLWLAEVRPESDSGGWGIDACLTRHTEIIERFFYRGILSKSGVGILRERDIGTIEQSEKGAAWLGDVRGKFSDLKKRGFKVVAFASQPFKSLPSEPGNQLPEDLREVYRQARFLGSEFNGLVDAWEMLGEPDIGYCTDLPDRVAAYQKALYLGLKAGAAEATKKPETGNLRPEIGENPQVSGLSSQVSQRAPLVLMGALGMPPGPWLERLAANDGLEYTDAYNFHFYGHAKDLTGVIEAHRAAIAALSTKGIERRDGEPIRQASASAQGYGPTQQGTMGAGLPLWITEAGIEAVDKKDWLNPQRRQMQADFTISTAKQALAASDVAVFMPFILVHDKNPYAMTLSPWKTFPAWDAYAKFTRENPWPKRALIREPQAVSSVVVQWLPDNRTTVPHKVAGTYRFKGDEPINGEMRVYNFGDVVVRGAIKSRLSDGSYGFLGAGRNFRITSNGQPITGLDEIEIPAMGMVAIPLEFIPSGKGYFRETWSAVFVEVGRVVPNAPNESPDGGGLGTSRPTFESRVSFGLETWAKPEDFVEVPLPLRPLPNGVIKFPQREPYLKGEQVGVWTTMNGLRGSAAHSSWLSDGSYQLPGKPHNSQPITKNADTAATFWIETENTDPLAPAAAVAAVDGLPASGFIRLQLDKPMSKDRKVLVVLVDDRGQRYSIWENFGVDYYGSRSDVLLNLEDIHADFWGPMSADYQFRPERIREVHLRLYLSTPNDPVQVELSVLTAKSMELRAK